MTEIKEAYTVYELEDAIVQAIEETEETPMHPREMDPSPGGRSGILYLRSRIERAKIEAKRSAGEAWKFQHPNTGSNRVEFPRPYIGAILDVLSEKVNKYKNDRTEEPNPRYDRRLSQMPLNQRILDRAEKILFGELEK